ncbi:hypothetical protein BH23ACT9_BH23ACT9_10910 [soil metagenome]
MSEFGEMLAEGPLAFNALETVTYAALVVMATSRDLQLGGDEGGHRERAITTIAEEQRPAAKGLGLAPEWRDMCAAPTPTQRMAAAENLVLATADGIDPLGRALIGLELSTAALWPADLSWLGEDADHVAAAYRTLDPSADRTQVTGLRRAVSRQQGRLARARLSPRTKTALKVGSVAVSAVSAATVAPVIAGAIGASMGLSGAAATSAGFAALGGGSLASGGFGMAGGALLLKVTTTAGYQGVKHVATSIAGASEAEFIRLLAQMHVAYRLLEVHRPEACPEVVAELRSVADELESVARAATERDLRTLEDRGEDPSALADRGRLEGAHRVVLEQLKAMEQPEGQVPWKSIGGAIAMLKPAELVSVLMR